MSKRYVIQINGIYTVERRNKEPKMHIGILQEDFPVEDEKYLNVSIEIDEEGNSFATFAVDEERKITDSIIRATQNLRDKRDALLKLTDHTQLTDAPIDSAKKAEYVTYRQALRDLPEDTVDVHNPVFPTKPE